MNGVFDLPPLLDGLTGSEKRGMDLAKHTAQKSIFPMPRKAEIELGCFSSTRTILSELMDAVLDSKNNEQVSNRSAKVLDFMGDQLVFEDENIYDSYRRVTDFASGMTDNHANRIAKLLNGQYY